ncbi:MAG: hypothetical protein HC893_17025 [Chloroflexaceae bacterium]|nr:hypothetical protein [Chloroflexaceae bacterium]
MRWPATFGAALGCGAHLAVLERTFVGSFTVDAAAPLETLQQAADLSPYLLPPDVVVSDWFPGDVERGAGPPRREWQHRASAQRCRGAGAGLHRRRSPTGAARMPRPCRARRAVATAQGVAVSRAAHPLPLTACPSVNKLFQRVKNHICTFFHNIV